MAMTRLVAASVIAGGLAGVMHAQAPAATKADANLCGPLSALRIPDVRIGEASHVGADAAAKGPVHVAHCQVTGTIGAEIGFALWLPDAWNGRFMMTGGGGFVGDIPPPGGGVDRGFAVTSTDTGHRADGVDASWALDDLERQINFGYLATHRTALTAKAIVREYYGADPHHAYFNGCSTGGRQALMEAQRFPGDFDGIVSGAPVFDWTHALAAGLSLAQTLYPDPAVLDKSPVSAENLELVHGAALAACDAADGVTDGVIDDPTKCRFDLRSVRSCGKGKPGPDCLTDDQRAAIARVYAPMRDADGTVYEGMPVGGEAEPQGWAGWITGSDPKMLAKDGYPNLSWGFSTQFFKYFVFNDASWSYRGYDVARSWRRDTKRISRFMDADSPDLSAFRARRGKLLLWHGWADSAVNPLATIRYYNSVVSRDPSARDDVRLFMLPGVLHCGGGAGPDQVDRIAAMVDWVDKGVAPSRLIAAKRDQGALVRTRPLCAYPATAAYTGHGSTDEAANFVCR